MKPLFCRTVGRAVCYHSIIHHGVSLSCYQDEEEPKDDQFSPDGGYIPRILFLGKWFNASSLFFRLHVWLKWVFKTFLSRTFPVLFRSCNPLIDGFLKKNVKPCYVPFVLISLGRKSESHSIFQHNHSWIKGLRQGIKPHTFLWTVSCMLNKCKSHWMTVFIEYNVIHLIMLKVHLGLIHNTNHVHSCLVCVQYIGMQCIQFPQGQ